MKKYIFICILLLFHTISYGYQGEYRDILLEKGIDIIESPRVDTSFPAWLKPSFNEDINHWKRVLPFPGDRNYDNYIVVPSLGLVAPIIQPLESDTINNFDYLSMLEQGVALYPNRDGDLGSWGNSVIFGHSSYLSYKQGRYKTIFSVLPVLNTGDEIWLFRKQFGSFQLYKYHILHSYETTPYDSFVTQRSTRKLLTLFTCTDIGTTDKRWLIKAEQIQGDTYLPYNHTKTNTTTPTQPTNSSDYNIQEAYQIRRPIEQEELDSIFDTFQ